MGWNTSAVPSMADSLIVYGSGIAHSPDITIHINNVGDEDFIVEIGESISFSVAEKYLSMDRVALIGNSSARGRLSYVILKASHGGRHFCSDDGAVIRGTCSGVGWEEMTEFELVVRGLPISKIPHVHNRDELIRAFSRTSTVFTGQITRFGQE